MSETELIDLSRSDSSIVCMENSDDILDLTSINDASDQQSPQETIDLTTAEFCGRKKRQSHPGPSRTRSGCRKKRLQETATEGPEIDLLADEKGTEEFPSLTDIFGPEANNIFDTKSSQNKCKEAASDDVQVVTLTPGTSNPKGKSGKRNGPGVKRGQQKKAKKTKKQGRKRGFWYFPGMFQLMSSATVKNIANLTGMALGSLMNLAGNTDHSPTTLQPVRGNDQFTLKELDSSHKDYMIIQGMCKNKKISKIEAVENRVLEAQYKCWLTQIEKKVENENKMKYPAERWLFHGSLSKNLTKICSEGFDRSLAGQNGCMYGQGTYFSANMDYSLSFSGGGMVSEIQMLVARVLTGKYCQGRAKMKTLPDKSSFQSAVDNVDSPSIFVIFHDAFALPAFLVTVRVRE